LGVFRLPKAFHKKLVRLYPDAKLLAAPITLRNNMMTYPAEEEQNMRDFCTDRMTRYISSAQIFPCS